MPPAILGLVNDRLRAERTEVTRSAIRDAVRALLDEEHPTTVSIPAVARRAGVSVRTVYRHYPNKQALLDDVAEIQRRRVDAMMDGRADLFDDPSVYLPALWEDFAADLDAVRAQHASPAGADIRRRRLTDSRGQVIKRIEEAYPDASGDDHEALADVIILLTSSSAFLELHDRLDRSPAQAARLAWWAARAVQKQFHRDGGIR